MLNNNSYKIVFKSINFIICVGILNITLASEVEEKINRLLTPLESKAILYIQHDLSHRPRFWNNKCKGDGCGHDKGPDVYLNNKKVYKLYTNSYARIELDPGKYNLKIDWGWGMPIEEVVISNISLEAGEVKKYNYKVKILSTSTNMVMLSPGVPMVMGHAETKVELEDLSSMEYIIKTMPRLKTQKEIEKIWDSWGEQEDW